VTVRLYDTRSQALRDFEPLEPGKAGMYVCGPTVQSSPHIGHLRSALAYDLWRRWLEYRGYDVTFVRNVTDIDDKILDNASANEEWWALAYRVELEFTAGYNTLGMLPPTYEPRATASVPQMQDIIATLIEKGHAYVADDGTGDVYFDVKTWGAYGELTNQKLDDMEDSPDAPARGKRDPRDFALWKGTKAGEPESASWASPWGAGRPGWHIECSAMAAKYLGPAFDIHGGGVDLRFPHHENEMAQSRAAGQRFAQYWLHNAWITTAGEKMSKSLGNSLLIPEVLKRVRGIELRYYMVSAHYRSHVEFSFEALDDAAAAFRRIESFQERAGTTTKSTSYPEAFAAAMDDDLGTPAAIAVIHDRVREGNRLLAAGEPVDEVAAEVRAMCDVLGIDPADPNWGSLGRSDDARLSSAVDALVNVLLEERAAARAEKDWARADAIRDRIAAAGIQVEDTPDGTKWTLAEGGG
jgi:cysteinyl-tRNA synthetase